METIRRASPARDLTNTSRSSTFLSANDAISHKISGPLVATTVSSTIVSPRKKTPKGRNQLLSSEETIWGAINLNLIATLLLLQTVFGHLLITESTPYPIFFGMELSKFLFLMGWTKVRTKTSFRGEYFCLPHGRPRLTSFLFSSWCYTSGITDPME